MAGRTSNTQKFNSLRKQRELERDWDEMSSLGKIYVSSEVILYSIEDIVKMTRWSEATVQKLFNDPKFPSIDYGKRKLVENHALMQYLFLLCPEFDIINHTLVFIQKTFTGGQNIWDLG